jgi:hypothetical protein
MIVFIYYQENGEPKKYTISANSKRDFEISLKRFKELTGLNDEQFQMEVISSSKF